MEYTFICTEEFISGKLIDGTDIQTGLNLSATFLTEEEVIELIKILEEGVWDLRHRCMSVYRDAFIYEGDTYNICLSCGDFYKNNEKFFINDETIEKIKKFKNDKQL